MANSCTRCLLATRYSLTRYSLAFSPVPQHRVRLVGLGKRLQQVRFELALERAEVLLEMLHFARADDRRGDPRLRQDPGERHLDVGDAALLSDLAHPVDDLEVVVAI